MMVFKFKTQYGEFEVKISEVELETGFIIYKHPNKYFKIYFSKMEK